MTHQETRTKDVFVEKYSKPFLESKESKGRPKVLEDFVIGFCLDKNKAHPKI